MITEKRKRYRSATADLSLRDAIVYLLREERAMKISILIQLLQAETLTEEMIRAEVKSLSLQGTISYDTLYSQVQYENLG